MLRIAICESDIKNQKELLDYIGRDVEIDDNYQTECFDSGEEIIDRIQSGRFSFELLFLCVELQGISGFDVAMEIRERELDVDIIFLSKKQDTILESFHYKPYGFLWKPVSYVQFSKELSQYLKEKRTHRNECLTVAFRGSHQRINLNQVLYFVSKARKITCVMQTGEEIGFYCKLNDLEEKIKDLDFCRCHQSYFVNMNFVEKIIADQILVSGEYLPVSRKYRAYIREQWSAYHKNAYHSRKIDKEHNGNKNVVVTTSIAMSPHTYGTIVGMTGEYVNVAFRIESGEEVCIGRNSEVSNIVIENEKISRKHIAIVYDGLSQIYRVCDYSKNGSYTENGAALEKDQWTELECGSLLILADTDTQFLLV